MNDVGVALVWCATQVAFLGCFVALLFRLSRWAAPSASPLISVSSFVVVLGLSGLAWGPLPSYFDLFPTNNPAEVTTPGSETQFAGRGVVGSGSLWDGARQVADDFYRHAVDQIFGEGELANWSWTGLVGLLCLMGFAVGMMQLSMGLVAVSGYRRRSLPIKDSSFLALADRLRRKLGIGRHVELRVSSDLSTAATIGWLKPVILVPTDWWRWSDQERRAVLGHELAHISHNDYFAVLMAQFSIALHFYHPIVHWLAGRLRLEQELAADAAAAELAGGRQQYLTTLAAMALRESDRPIGWAARGFLPVRGAFLKRIESLRSGSAPKRLTACGHGLTIAALVVAGVLVSGL